MRPDGTDEADVSYAAEGHDRVEEHDATLRCLLRESRSRGGAGCIMERDARFDDVVEVEQAVPYGELGQLVGLQCISRLAARTVT
ncbi:hypothetical protein ACWGQ5_41840 [Streptomyces sp. NPDC055722]